MKDLQEVGDEITGNKCIHYRLQEFEIISCQVEHVQGKLIHY